MQITVADIQKIDVKDGQTLVVFVDISGYPRPTAEKIMQDAAKFMRAAIPNKAVQVIVVPKDRYTFGVIDPTTGQQLGTAGQIMGGGNGPKPSTPTDAFDHAMKGLG